jgi:nucleolar MIF4G domain-containing protein 1
MYDVIRHLIEKFSEVDIECLLLLLSHCGRSLRADDPLSLKEIVLLVQKKYSEVRGQESSSRAEYMVTAITDLKNNKRGKHDTAIGEKTNKLRKVLGQVKSIAAKSNTAKTASEATLRISLGDILSAETKGRWWKVGAKWIGNQYRFNGDSQSNPDEPDDETTTLPTSGQSEQDEALLKLATKLRMNTDRKRAIFCIIMGSEDCEDAFEKLCRGSMLQNKSERDACRVLLECCLNEKAYNKFYGHLAARMCEFQPQCKFSLQLAFWDMFKQFDSMDARKAANLAKLLFHLSVTHELLRLMTVLKAVDISEDDMEASALIFVTILTTSILDHFQDTGPIKAMFAARHSEHDDETRQEQEEGARASLLVFFMETLKASPKNVKGSQFRKNFKAAVKALDTDGFENML